MGASFHDLDHPHLPWPNRLRGLTILESRKWAPASWFHKRQQGPCSGPGGGGTATGTHRCCSIQKLELATRQHQFTAGPSWGRWVRQGQETRLEGGGPGCQSHQLYPCRKPPLPALPRDPPHSAGMAGKRAAPSRVRWQPQGPHLSKLNGACAWWANEDGNESGAHPGNCCGRVGGPKEDTGEAKGVQTLGDEI